MKHINATWLAIPLLLGACSSTPFNHLNHYFEKRGITPPTNSEFQSCRAYGCQKVDQIKLTEQEWASIDAPFTAPTKNAQEEREKIKQSIAAFEKAVGQHNGTSQDIWGTFQKTGHKQQDCVDESTNTSIYLSVLKNRGLLKFHSVEIPQSRVPFMRWPHQTAVIKENQSQKRYAVDSWFHNNGEPPEIVDFKIWKEGWKPNKRQ